MKVNVLLNTHGLLVLNKPAGVVTQGGKLLPQPELTEYIPNRFPGYDLAHRTDRFTSGVIVCADRQTRGYLHKNWHTVTRKAYLAIIKSPTWDLKTVGTPVDGKSCKTAFQVLQRWGEYALVICELVQNGRRHQIRVHLQSIGYAIVGDRLYKNGGAKTSVRNGQLLHAWEMRLKMPHGEVIIQAPIPDDFKSFEFDWDLIDTGHTTTKSVLDLPDTWNR